MNFKTYKGKFKPKNPEKYKGDSNNIVYRSGWERSVMLYFDRAEAVLEWNSEEVVIPYVSPWDERVHRYFPDFWAKVKTFDGVKEFIIEVKPEKETKPPKQPKRRTKRFLQEVATWGINSAKWTAAKHFCDEKGMKFQILTEKDINVYGNTKVQ